MHVDPYYCIECRCYHDKHVTKPVYFDIADNCLAAEKWYLDNSEESTQVYMHESAWKESVKHVALSMPQFTTVHGCGCTTITHDNFKMEWCYECSKRREQERYDYQGLS